jgi:hypothetical protein
VDELAGPVWRARAHVQRAELPAPVQKGEPLPVWELVMRERLVAQELLPALVEQPGLDWQDEVAAVLVQLRQERLEQAPL